MDSAPFTHPSITGLTIDCMQQFDCIAQHSNSQNGQPVWISSQESLFWVDHSTQRLYQYHEPTNEITHFTMDAPILSLSPSLHHGFIATLEDGIGFYDMQSRQVTYISKPEPFAIDKETIAGITDVYGNFWSFTHPKNNSGPVHGNLYQLDTQMAMQKISGNQWSCTAPPAFSKDGSILYQSSRNTRYIYATKLNEQRQPVETQSFCRIAKPDGYPHGLCVDSDDCLWVCHRGEGYLSQYSPKGECLQKIKIETPGIKYCTFGGKDLDTLFLVTSGHEDLTRVRRKMRYFDTILAFKPGAIGVEPHQFVG